MTVSAIKWLLLSGKSMWASTTLVIQSQLGVITMSVLRRSPVFSFPFRAFVFHSFHNGELLHLSDSTRNVVSLSKKQKPKQNITRFTAVTATNSIAVMWRRFQTEGQSSHHDSVRVTIFSMKQTFPCADLKRQTQSVTLLTADAELCSEGKFKFNQANSFDPALNQWRRHLKHATISPSGFQQKQRAPLLWKQISGWGWSAEHPTDEEIKQFKHRKRKQNERKKSGDTWKN